MKKSKSIKLKESPQSKTIKTILPCESEKNLIFKRNNNKKKDLKKLHTNKTNTNETIINISKDEKKEIGIKKKFSKEIPKSKRNSIFNNMSNKNKTIEIPNSLTFKKTKKIIKKNGSNSHFHKKKKKLRNSLSQRNLNKIKSNYSNKYNLTKNNTSNTSNLENDRSDSINNILSGSDNFIKVLLSNYIDGTDNIINEDLEQFNNIDNNDDYENSSFFESKDSNTVRVKEPINMKKSFAKSNECNTINISKNLKKISKIANKRNSICNTNNIFNSFMTSPTKLIEGRLTMRNKKNIINIPNKRQSFSKNIKNDKEKENIRNNETKESNLRRKILYSNQIINNLNKSKQNNKINDIEKKQRETISATTTNINLDTIFENNITKIDQVPHHYLEYTVSTKNKIVQKKKINSFEQSKNYISSFNKIETICEFNDKNPNNFRKTIFRVNRTPKIQKDFKGNERFSFHNINNNITNYKRKYSYHLKREMSGENNIRISSMINSKIFNGKITDYLITKELGKGSYAVVKLAVHKTTKNKYAIKIYSKQSLIDPQKRNTVKNEINILKQLDNENIMKLYEVIDTPSKLYLVLEYINGINLLEIMKNEKYHFLKEERAKKIFLQVVEGISYCHKKNIFHRDIKLENILVLKDDTVKIIDFGFGVKCNRDTFQKLFCGTPSYMPPEIVKKEKYMACYSDIWSLGVLFYALLFGIFPFKGKNEDDLFEKINEAKFNFPEYNEICEKTRQLFEKIFVKIPNERISLDEIINMLKEE